MKKYLFLIILFVIYVLLISFNKTEPVLSYDSIDEVGVSEYYIEFKNGINSNNLDTIFNKYNKEYYITYIKIKNDNEYKTSCNYINNCIKDIYKQESNEFNTKYINGISITNLHLLAYKDEMSKFLDKNNIDYIINKED